MKPINFILSFSLLFPLVCVHAEHGSSALKMQNIDNLALEEIIITKPSKTVVISDKNNHRYLAGPGTQIDDIPPDAPSTGKSLYVVWEIESNKVILKQLIDEPEGWSEYFYEWKVGQKPKIIE